MRAHAAAVLDLEVRPIVAVELVAHVVHVVMLLIDQKHDLRPIVVEVFLEEQQLLSRAVSAHAEVDDLPAGHERSQPVGKAVFHLHVVAPHEGVSDESDAGSTAGKVFGVAEAPAVVHDPDSHAAFVEAARVLTREPPQESVVAIRQIPLVITDLEGLVEEDSGDDLEAHGERNGEQRHQQKTQEEAFGGRHFRR